MSSDETTPDRLAVAEALADKAWQVDQDVGPAAGLEPLHELVDLVRGAEDPASRALLIWGLNAISQAHADLGNIVESRSAALEIVDQHFDDPPAAALDVVPFAAFRLAAFLDDDGEDAQAIALLRRLIERYGRPGVPDNRLIAAVAHGSIGRILNDTGHREDARRELQTVIELLGDPDNEEAQALVAESGEREARLALADALATEAEFLYAEAHQDEGDARLRDLIDRFEGATEGKIREFVTWATNTLEESRTYSRPRRLRWRR